MFGLDDKLESLFCSILVKEIKDYERNFNFKRKNVVYTLNKLQILRIFFNLANNDDLYKFVNIYAKLTENNTNTNVVFKFLGNKIVNTIEKSN